MKALQFIGYLLLIVLLTLLTQIGGLILLLCLLTKDLLPGKFKGKLTVYFLTFYSLATWILVPQIAPLLGRAPIVKTATIKPTFFLTNYLNRNYVVPELNDVLLKTEAQLAPSGIQIRYLDANFPFVNGFPLLPHLSHNDGRKLDLSFIYESERGELSNKKKAVSGYGVFVASAPNTPDQTQQCKAQGHWQYDMTKYFSFGRINTSLRFSQKHTRQLTLALLDQPEVQKIFLEPHIKSSLGLRDQRIRFHGCHAVRHDDHIHLQIR